MPRRTASHAISSRPPSAGSSSRPMPTISADRALRAPAVLLLLSMAGAASASGTIEIDPRTEAFASRADCEQALEKRHSAAQSRLASLSGAERRGNKVGKLRRDGQHLSYAE